MALALQKGTGRYASRSIVLTKTYPNSTAMSKKQTAFI